MRLNLTDGSSWFNVRPAEKSCWDRLARRCFADHVHAMVRPRYRSATSDHARKSKAGCNEGTKRTQGSWLGRQGSQPPERALQCSPELCSKGCASAAHRPRMKLSVAPLRHYIVLLCIRLFESTGKSTSSATKAVAASSAMLPLVTARPGVFGRGFGGRFCQGKHMAGKLRPLDVERETRPGRYFDGDGLYLVVKGATSRNWIYRYRKNTVKSAGSA
jgi:hypothetical protein